MSVTQLLNRVIGIPFYQRNAGFFLFLFIALFGIVPGSQLISYHRTLIEAMLESWAFMMVVSFIWLLYGWKCYQFVMNILSEQQQQFLYLTGCLPVNEQFRSILITQLFIYLPVAVYALIVATTGFISGTPAAAVYVILFHSLICLFSIRLYIRRLRHPDSGKSFFLSSPFHLKITKTYPLFFIWRLLNEMKAIFVVTKLFSVIILLAFLNGFFLDTYDGRVVMLGFMAGLTAHCVMVFEFRKFEESQMLFYRNLPVSMIRRLLNMAVVYSLILLPEWFLFIAAFPERLQPGDIWWLPLFGTGMLLLYHSILYKPPMDMERYLQWIFGISAVLFFLVLYHLFLFIIVLLFGAALFFFYRWYLKFELTDGQI